MENTSTIYELPFDNTLISELKVIIGSVQQFRTNYVAGNLHKEKKIYSWSPCNEKENVLIAKDIGNMAARLSYVIENESDINKL